ncbi:MAG: DNA methyltransferase [Bacteroidales bacterium]|nr:DNA methyltransferase [Bacteroidales bacterium]
MKYKVERNTKYDFAGQSYASKYPNLHRYPATMLPQIGIEILKELNIKSGRMLDPYCGSGSSFASGLEVGINEMYGFDINPLAVLISKAKFTKTNVPEARSESQKLRTNIYEFLKDENNFNKLKSPKIKNIDYWFSKEITQNISILKYFIYQIEDENIRRLFSIPFAETVRACSYTRAGEFKLYRIKPELITDFNPDVFGVFFSKLKKTLDIYQVIYYPKLKKGIKISVEYKKFEPKDDFFDIVLTSPPYGDSKTTVAYGQFSNFANEWLDIDYARKIDSMLMGGKTEKKLYKDGLIYDYLYEIFKNFEKRSYEISSFYRDLEFSINKVAKSVKKGGYIVYIVGNRLVKDVQLPTDQFIAEKFEKQDYKHLITYERLLGNKSMPSKNSPTNKKGVKKSTMITEYIVVCKRKK